jgi:hypothetical protein
MKLILTGLILVFIGTTFWYKHQYDTTNAKFEMVADSLEHYIYKEISDPIKWSEHLELNRDLNAIMGPKDQALGDSLLESHRIAWFASAAHVFQIHQKKDSSVHLIYRRFTLKNPLTQQGETAVQGTEHVLVPAPVFQKFKEKLAEISFLDASRNTDYLCCFNTGSLSWEARLNNNMILAHKTWCRQSVQFAEACETIMYLVKDANLQSALAHIERN